MRGPCEDGVAVLPGEQWQQDRDSAEVHAAVAEHGEQHRVLARGAGDGDAKVGLGLREVEPLGAVDEHRWCGLAGVEPPRVHLADMSDKVGLDAARVRDELGKTAYELVVAE